MQVLLNLSPPSVKKLFILIQEILYIILLYFQLFPESCHITKKVLFAPTIKQEEKPAQSNLGWYTVNQGGYTLTRIPKNEQV